METYTSFSKDIIVATYIIRSKEISLEWNPIQTNIKENKLLKVETNKLMAFTGNRIRYFRIKI